MPDALSKTVGIWIVVLNRLLFPDRTDSHELMTPNEVVSDSEHAQMEERLDRFVKEAQSLDLDLDELRGKVKKPMRPYWVTPATSLDSLSKPADDDTFATVVLCVASSKPSIEVRDNPSYVQGAADDHEAWSCGLTAPVFWANREDLLATAEDDLPAKIAAAVVPLGLNPQALPLFIGALAAHNDAALFAVPGVSPQIIGAGVQALQQAYLESFRGVWIAAAVVSFVTMIGTSLLISQELLLTLS